MKGYKQDWENELWGMIAAVTFVLVMAFGTVSALVFMVRYLLVG